MDLPAQAATMYTPEAWALITHAASATNPDGSYQYTLTDLASAASANRAALGLSGTYSAPGLSQLFSIARTMENAATALTNAPDESAIESHMVSEPPWSRPPTVQDTAPVWQTRFQVTYTTPQGAQVQTWLTGWFHNVLPTSVGNFNTELFLQADRILSQAGKRYEPAQQVNSIDRTYLMAV